MKQFSGRKVVVSALVGSHNYNLNDERSDKDYKYFVLPTFDDLYQGKMFSLAKESSVLDYTVHDVRKLVNMLWKANINFLEILFSTEIEVDPLFHGIYSLREYISRMNIPYLYSACKGMHFEKMKHLDKGTSTTQALVEKFGYDTKNAMHAYRVIDFCERFAENDWNFEAAMYYNSDDPMRAYLLSLKRGEIKREQFLQDISCKYSEFEKLEPMFKLMSPREATKERMYNIIKNVVHDKMKG